LFRSGSDLAKRLWKELTKAEPQSEDLIETASVLERRYSRRAVVEIVKNLLAPLEPTGGLLAIPAFGWPALFSTNFDRVVEKAYKKARIGLSVIRSNFDVTNKETRVETTLYKIHGCITQDRGFGDKSSMILTEHDYEEFDRYRQSLFTNLQSLMFTNDVIVIGQSLRDPHLHKLVREVLDLRQEGVDSRVFVLAYDPDDLRAPLLEDRGAKVAFGGIDEFAHALASNIPIGPTQTSTSSGEGIELPISLVSTVYDVGHRCSGEAPNVLRMFNGGPATYADIRSGATFERSQFNQLAGHIAQQDTPVITIVGAAGVGKTTFGRQLALQATSAGIPVWEHRTDFPFQSKPWIDVEKSLRLKGQRAILVLDECTRYLRQSNLLIDALGAIDSPALLLVMTANAAQWTPRLKSPIIYKKGVNVTLSVLNNVEINSLINLYQNNQEVSGLVDRPFKSLSRGDQQKRLREKCGADMFVCLNNIFANENLDTILLTEFEELDAHVQEYYRYVSALEAIGTRVHRQLLMRMLGIGAQAVGEALKSLSGIIDEYDIKPKLGIYGWATRHIVIARKITDYKFSNFEELERLFETVIDHINPTVSIELQSIRDLCDVEFGIGRLSDTKARQRLYRKLIEVAEGERIPWHRLVRELLEHEGLDEAEFALKKALETVGSDGPLDRFKVRLLMARADRTPGIADGDRLALVRRAYETAESNVSHHSKDKFSYRALCDVAVELVRRGESPYILDEAINKLRHASEEILDPDMDRQIRYFEDIRSRL
ncbi:MAG: SIR2 family protein, partial [Parvibaculaceae bacterium]